jgi:hypothetical protein
MALLNEAASRHFAGGVIGIFSHLHRASGNADTAALLHPDSIESV